MAPFNCFHEIELTKYLDELLDHYFSQLSYSLQKEGHSHRVTQLVCSEWRQLFPIAWADFHRFLLG